MALRITDAQLSVLAAAGCGVQEVPVTLTLELRDEDGEPVPDERLEEVGDVSSSWTAAPSAQPGRRMPT